MTYPQDLIDRYVAMWNETDPTRRQKHVNQLFTPTAIRYNPVAIQQGREAIADSVNTSYERFTTKGFRFRALRNLLAHHDAIKFSWEMVNEHEAVDSIGTTFLLLDPDRRIRLDYQFAENSLPPEVVNRSGTGGSPRSHG